MTRLTKSLSFCAALFCSSAAFAVPITYTFTGNAAGGPANAEALFTTGADTVSITLNDLLSNPSNVGQLISDLSFTLSNAPTGTPSLTSGTGTALTVNGTGTFSVGGSVAAGWVLSSPSAGTLHLDDLVGTGHAGPAHLIIGTSSNGTYTGGTYSNGNGSIAGNGPHNPFLESGAIFNLSVPGVTANTTITSATFSFGTTSGDNRAGTPNAPTVPDGGTTLMLLGSALGGLGAMRRFLKS